MGEMALLEKVKGISFNLITAAFYLFFEPHLAVLKVHQVAFRVYFLLCTQGSVLVGWETGWSARDETPVDLL